MLTRVMSLVHLDFAPNHEQPQAGRVALATVVSLVGSLLANAVLVVIAQALIPGTKGYAHFQFGDYAKLTVIGVLIACAAWPVTTRITSQPRWMFFRMAVLVTLVLWLPDVYILMKGQPGKAVAVLFVMHAGDRARYLQRARSPGAGPRAATPAPARAAGHPVTVDLRNSRSLGERIGFHGRGATVNVTGQTVNVTT